jgi:hypothetical protein
MGMLILVVFCTTASLDAVGGTMDVGLYSGSQSAAFCFFNFSAALSRLWKEPTRSSRDLTCLSLLMVTGEVNAVTSGGISAVIMPISLSSLYAGCSPALRKMPLARVSPDCAGDAVPASIFACEAAASCDVPVTLSSSEPVAAGSSSRTPRRLIAVPFSVLLIGVEDPQPIYRRGVPPLYTFPRSPGGQR